MLVGPWGYTAIFLILYRPGITDIDDTIVWLVVRLGYTSYDQSVQQYALNK